MKKTTTLMGVMSLVAASLAITVAAPAANASPTAGEDRQLTTPTSWWTYTGLTAAQVTTTVNDNHARLTDIRVTPTSTGSPRFTATEVANTGSYATGWYWYYGLTPSDTGEKAISNDARVTVANCYVQSGKTLCASIMVNNTGTNREAWSMYTGSISTLASKATSSNRVVSFSRIVGSSSYVAVFGSDTGSHAIPSYYWWAGQSISSLLSKASSEKGRIVDLDRNPDGTYNAVIYANPTNSFWYVYTGQSMSSLVNHALQLGERLIDVTPYVVRGTTYYAGVLASNMNAATAAAMNALAGKVPNGNWGFELAQVGGPVLAGIETTRGFEPASALKVLYHYKSIVSEQSGATSDSSSIAYRYNPDDPTNKDICPDDYNSVGSTNLKNADTQMMQVSDNRMTRGILEKYGKSAMLAEAAHLGMTGTTINHNIGCPTASTHNQTTLSDLDKLYSAFQQGKDITNPTWQAAFRSRMLNQSNYPSAIDTIRLIVNQEAAKLHLSQSTADAFTAKITWIAKGGSYQYSGDDVAGPFSWSNGSLTTLPFKSGSRIVAKAYFYGDYFDEVSFTSATAKNALATARTTAFQEALRPQIHAALATW